MFKLICLALVAGAFATDAAAPVITLDLVDATMTTHPNHPSDPISHEALVKSNSHFADVCEVDVVCTLPTARAYDHHDGDLTASITTAYNLFVSSPPCTAAGGCAATETNEDQPTTPAPDFEKTRGEWVLTYDVMDGSSNAAESVTFALIVKDTTAPTVIAGEFQDISWNYGHASSFSFATVADFEDNYDQVEEVTKITDTQYDSCYAVGTHADAYKVCDYAAIFGADYKDNCATHSRNVNIAYENTVAAGNVHHHIIAGSHTGFTLECQKTNFVTEADKSDCSITHKGCNCVAPLGDESLTAAASMADAGFCNFYPTVTSFSGAVGTFSVALNAKIPAETSSQHISTGTAATFTVVDDTPPTITWDYVSTSSAYFKKHGSSTPTFTQGEAGNDYYQHAQDGTGGLNVNMRLTNNDVIQHSAGYELDAAQINGGDGIGVHRFSCVDDCTTVLTETGSWFDGLGFSCDADTTHSAASAVTMNLLRAGTFVFKYTCQDEQSNLAVSCKTVMNVDHTKPVINPVDGVNQLCTDQGLDGTCWEASSTAMYDDAGAICSDMVDGDISELVEVSGDVVSLSVVDTYRITYKCADTAGNDAVEAVRTVFVVDAACPTCIVTAGASITEEASFPYTDAAVSCADNMPFTENGDDFTKVATVTTAQAVDVEQTGAYTLTYNAVDVAGNTNFALQSGTPCNVGMQQTRTITVVDSLKPIITIDGQGAYMAEESHGLNAWVIGAMASAVTGVALLGYASSKTTATVVPV
jgi:hypothetical protein